MAGGRPGLPANAQGSEYRVEKSPSALRRVMCAFADYVPPLAFRLTHSDTSPPPPCRLLPAEFWREPPGSKDPAAGPVRTTLLPGHTRLVENTHHLQLSRPAFSLDRVSVGLLSKCARPVLQPVGQPRPRLATRSFQALSRWVVEMPSRLEELFRKSL